MLIYLLGLLSGWANLKQGWYGQAWEGFCASPLKQLPGQKEKLSGFLDS